MSLMVSHPAKLIIGYQLKLSGTFEYEEYISLKSINDPNEGLVTTAAWHEIMLI